MNSEDSYNKFKGQYDELFANHELVVSLPYSISLFGGTACVFGGPVLNQPIPQRAYIGFRRNKISTGLQITSYKRINHQTQNIEEVKNDSFYAPDGNFVEKLGIYFPDTHVDISFFTEFEGKNADLICGGTILGLDLLFGNIEFGMVDFLKKSDSGVLQKNEYVKELLRKTLLLRMSYNKSTIGGSCLDCFVSVLIDSELPVLHIQEKGLYSLDGDTVNKNEIQNIVSNSPVSYISRRIEELLDVAFNKELPFDIMMFGLGDYRNIGWYQSFLNWGDNSKNLKQMLLMSELENSNSFYLEMTGKNRLLYKSIEVISEYIFHVTKIFLDTLLAKEKVGTLFFHLRRNMELINTLLGKYNLTSHEGEDSDIIGLEQLLGLLYPMLNKNDYFIYSTGSSVDLKYVVLFPKYLPIYPTKELQLRLQSIFHKNVSLMYSSKNDGYSKEGLRIEQFIEQQIYSKHNSEKDYILTDKDGFVMLCSNLEDAYSKTESGILLDTINKKILINGEHLSSKELLSQSATVDLLSLLIQNIGLEISNLELPKSGYSKNKNEMTGKIIIPLTRIIEQKCSYQFPITCSGSINEFYLKLSYPSLNVVILRRR